MRRMHAATIRRSRRRCSRKPAARSRERRRLHLRRRRRATARQDRRSGQNFEPNEIRAWSILTDAAGPGQPAHDRVQAMAALGTMGNDERAARLIEEGFTAKDYDVRVAAVLAAGLTKNPKLIAAAAARAGRRQRAGRLHGRDHAVEDA